MHGFCSSLASLKKINMKKIFLILMIVCVCLLSKNLFAQKDSMSIGMKQDTMPNQMMKDPASNSMMGDSMHDNMMSNDTTKKPEDKSKRPSPPATATGTTKSGTNITIDYGQPSVKGRVIGTGVEPHKHSLCRTGANEATVFTIDKDATINGKSLSAGKYGFFTIWKGDSWTLIFNKTWDQWGAYDYKQADDILLVDVKNVKPATMSEKMTFTIDNSGKVSLAWGNVGFDFAVK